MTAVSVDAAAVEAARVVLQQATGQAGFAAAVGDDHYGAVWTRDAAITCLGALADGDDRWHPAILASLRTVADRAADRGQLPNTVWSDGWYDFGEHASVDATAWWCVAVLAAVEHGVAGVDALLPTVTTSLGWLRSLDAGGWGLVVQPGAGDWMDSSLQRSGIVLHTNALVVDALRRADRLRAATGGWPAADDVARTLDLLLWPRAGTDLADLLAHLPAETRRRGFPHPATRSAYARAVGRPRAHWASHLRWGHLVEVADVLGICLAVLTGLGSAPRRQAAVAAVAAAAQPYASRSLLEPVPADDVGGMFDASADRAQDPRWRNPPWRYHNAGCWPMVGGFHVAAACAVGAPTDDLISSLVAGCRAQDGTWLFPEWRDGRTGEPGATGQQTWSAAAVLLAAAPGAVWPPTSRT